MKLKQLKMMRLGQKFQYFNNYLVESVWHFDVDDCGYDDDLDWGMWDCCYFSGYQHLVLMWAVHDPVRDQTQIYCDVI